MSLIRSYIPDLISNHVMYYLGGAMCRLQYYVNNTFTASEITPRIFVGDLASASNIRAMKEQGITHILTVINGAFELFPSELCYKIIHINDDPWVNIGKYFDESNLFIDDALRIQDAKVMIHCQRGVSRSVTILLAYMLYKQNEANQIPVEQIDQAIDAVLGEVRSHRPIAEPNEGFVESLKIYICQLNNYSLFSVEPRGPES